AAAGPAAAAPPPWPRPGCGVASRSTGWPPRGASRAAAGRSAPNPGTRPGALLARCPRPPSGCPTVRGPDAPGRGTPAGRSPRTALPAIGARWRPPKPPRLPPAPPWPSRPCWCSPFIRRTKHRFRLAAIRNLVSLRGRPCGRGKADDYQHRLRLSHSGTRRLRPVSRAEALHPSRPVARPSRRSQLCDQCRDRLGGDGPHLIRVHAVIVVSEHRPQPHHGRPPDLRIPRPSPLPQPPRGLADDLEQALDGELTDAIGIPGLLALLSQGGHLRSSVENVIDPLLVGTAHRSTASSRMAVSRAFSPPRETTSTRCPSSASSSWPRCRRSNSELPGPKSTSRSMSLPACSWPRATEPNSRTRWPPCWATSLLISLRRSSTSERSGIAAASEASRVVAIVTLEATSSHRADHP